MLYHYITHYAQAKADLALLTVNTLQKDGRDENPVIRGLAIRSMASLRVPDLVEYLVSVAKRRARERRLSRVRTGGLLLLPVVVVMKPCLSPRIPRVLRKGGRGLASSQP
jgi:hypothetical protein